MKPYASIEACWTKSEIDPGDGWIKSACQNEGDNGTVWLKWHGQPDWMIQVQNDMIEHVIQSSPEWGLKVVGSGFPWSVLQRSQ